MDYDPAEPDDDASADTLRDYVRGFLVRHTATGLAALSTLYWPVGRAWIRLKKHDKKEIKAAGGVKNYADKYFGKGYTNVNWCANSWKKYEERPDVHQKAMEWWEGLNEQPTLKQTFAPRVHIEILELYTNRFSPPPTKEDKEAEEKAEKEGDLGVSSSDLEAANHIIQLHESKIERLERENQVLRRALIVKGIEVPMSEDLTAWMQSLEDQAFDTSKAPAEAVGDMAPTPSAPRKRAPRKAPAKAPAKGMNDDIFDNDEKE